MGVGVHDEELRSWAQSYGSGRLAQAIAEEDSALAEELYVRERRDQELPSFLIDVDDWVMEPLTDPTPDVEELLLDIREYLDVLNIQHDSCDLVLVTDDDSVGRYESVPAVRITGWLGERVLLGLAPPGVGWLPTIGVGFPFGSPTVTGDALRPTGYGSAYGIRHPAAQEALRTSAVILIDTFPDGEPKEELLELWPSDARDLIDDELIHDLMDTVFLVGWKLGQPTRLELASFAEHIAAVLMFHEAEGLLDGYSEHLPPDAYEPALENLRDGLEALLDEDFAFHLPYITDASLAVFVPSGVASRRMSLWAPLHRTAGDPPPRITSDEEPDWSITSLPGVTPREANKASGERDAAERRSKLRYVAQLMSDVQWRCETVRGQPVLVGDTSERSGELVLWGPTAGRAARTYSVWPVERYETAGAFEDPESENDEQWHLSWPELFEVLAPSEHPFAVDLVMEVVDRTMNWAHGVVGHALPGGQLDPLREAPKLLDGAVALREHLEKVRASGLVHDARLTRNGINHPQFGHPDGMRFLARARFGVPDDREFAQVQADFNQSIYDFSPLPVSLGIEPHEDDDVSVVVTCALDAPSVEDALELSNEVITQVRWRVGLMPINFEDGDDVNEIRYDLEDLQAIDDDSGSED